VGPFCPGLGLPRTGKSSAPPESLLHFAFRAQIRLAPKVCRRTAPGLLPESQCSEDGEGGSYMHPPPLRLSARLLILFRLRRKLDLAYLRIGRVFTNRRN
jgi:hypothetical protein